MAVIYYTIKPNIDLNKLKKGLTKRQKRVIRKIFVV
jgi:hypothetical protein